MPRLIYTIPLIITLLLAAIQSHAEIPRILGIIKSDTTHTEMGRNVILPAGDQNGDGLADFWTTDWRNKAFLFRGDTIGLSSIPVVVLDSVLYFSSNLGDLSGDGYPDYSFTGFRNGVSRMDIFYGGPSMDDLLDLHFGENTGSCPASYQPHGNAVRGDFDADGYDELITGSRDQLYALSYRLHPPGDTLHHLVFRPTGFSFPGYTFGFGIVAGDFTGDGQIDLALSLNPDMMCECKGEVWFYKGGVGFDTIPELRFTQPGPWQLSADRFGWVMVNLGDANGDGYDDLYISPGNSSDSLSFIYFGGPGFDSIPDVTIAQDAITAASGGDINRDGYPDLITSFPLESSSGSRVYIYYGGPEMDSLADVQIYARDLPEYSLWFGAAVAGLGDVNGDGVDDFAASALQDFSGRGEVFIFSGTGESTAVDDEPEDLPSSFTLYQNYPNPFNPSTTISFELERRSHVTLTVLNMVGQEVACLLDRELASGSHSVRWNGATDDGTPVASGIYLYRLTAGETVQSRKMELVK